MAHFLIIVIDLFLIIQDYYYSNIYEKDCFFNNVYKF